MIAEVRGMIAGDEPEFSSLFAADGVLRFPFAPPAKPAELRGRAAIREYYRAGESTKRLLDMAEVRTAVHRTEDPEMVVAEFSHHSRSQATGEPYTFQALAVARVRDGRIVRYEDYIDSIAMAWMLGRTQDLAETLTS